jgi:hypothetical protein
MTNPLQRFLNIRREEIAPLLVSAFYFCCVLAAASTPSAGCSSAPRSSPSP